MMNIDELTNVDLLSLSEIKNPIENPKFMPFYLNNHSSGHANQQNELNCVESFSSLNFNDRILPPSKESSQLFVSTSGSSLSLSSLSNNKQVNDYSADKLHELNLNSRIKYLEEELANTQADKEFVWSLWRQLQSTNPDLTNAISAVVQREKDKSEAKDQKVLEILQVKDSKLEELQKSISDKQEEYSKIKEKLKAFDLKLNTKDEEINYLKLNLKTYEDKINLYEQMIRGRDEKYEKLFNDSENEKNHLISKLKEVLIEIDQYQNRENEYKLECEKHKENINILHEQMKHANDNYEKLIEELNKFSQQTDGYKNLKVENEYFKSEIKTKSEKNEKLRAELDDLWSKFNKNIDYMNQQDKMIKQLKSVQNDLQATIKTQHQTYEEENASLKLMYNQISKKYEESLAIEKKIMNDALNMQQKSQQEQMIKSQQMKLSEKSLNDLIDAQKYEIDQLKLECSLIEQKLNDKNLLCEELEKKLDEYEYAKTSGKKLPLFRKPPSKPKLPKMNQIRPAFKENSKITRSKSFDRNLNLRTKENRIDAMDLAYEKYLTDDEEITYTENFKRSREINSQRNINKIKLFYENLCKAKDKQLTTLRQSHDNRLQRLIHLEKQHKLLREHLMLYVDEDEFIDNKKETKPKSNQVNNKLFGYKRKDNELLSNELKVLHQENNELLSENFRVREENESIKLRCDELNEEIEKLKIELNLKVDETKLDHTLTKEKFENDLKITVDKLKQANDELVRLKLVEADLNSKCEHSNKERMKYVDLCEKLSKENKKIYKKWFQIRKNDNKYRMLLIDQMSKQSNVKLNRKVYRKHMSNKKTKLSPVKAQNKSYDFLHSLVCSASPLLLSSAASSTNNLQENKISASKQNNKIRKSKTTHKDKVINELKKRQEQLSLQKLDLEQKLNNLTKNQETSLKELEAMEAKVKQLRAQNEKFSNELNNLKKRESEWKEKEDAIRKSEELTREDIKKSLEAKIKQSSNDLTKQIASNKNLKNENEKMSDKLRVNEEKLNHIERDLGQKKQLIEFYKKKLEELNTKEKNELIAKYDDSNESTNELKTQLKKLTELNEKSKTEIKTLKIRIQSILTEKDSIEQSKSSIEKNLNETNQKFNSTFKEKAKLESNLKQLKIRIQDMESYINDLENTAQSKIQSLSETSQQTLSLAQLKLKQAYKLVENYEQIITYLYESLINKVIEQRREIKAERLKKSKKVIATSNKLEPDESMKLAMNLASSVLNLTYNELDDLMSLNANDNQVLVSKKMDQNQNLHDESRDEESNYALGKKLLSEFEQHLSSSKSEAPIDLNNLNSHSSYETKNITVNKEICNLIANRLNDVFNYEKELVTLKYRE